jgi:hypothetical protein
VHFSTEISSFSCPWIRIPNTDPDPQSHWIRIHNPDWNRKNQCWGSGMTILDLEIFHSGSWILYFFIPDSTRTQTEEWKIKTTVFLAPYGFRNNSWSFINHTVAVTLYKKGFPIPCTRPPYPEGKKGIGSRIRNTGQNTILFRLPVSF